MADISITQAHELTHANARAVAQEAARQLAEKYDMACEWSGDVLLFKRSGVSGSLALLEGAARLDISLGFLLMAFAPMIQEKAAAKMQKVFSGAA